MIDPFLMIRASKHWFLLNFEATNFNEFIRLEIFKYLFTLPLKIFYVPHGHNKVYLLFAIYDTSVIFSQLTYLN